MFHSAFIRIPALCIALVAHQSTAIAQPVSPTLILSSYLGGSGTEVTTGIAVDADGNICVTGYTRSTNFPTKNALQPNYGGGEYDAFVTKISASGAIVFSTYLGGSSGDLGRSIAVDSDGNIYVGGDTRSADFPLSAGAFQTVRRGDEDSVVVKLNPTGTSMIYATLLGGDFSEDLFGLAVDATGNAYISGNTQGGDYPTTQGAFQTRSQGSNDGYVTKLNPTGTGLAYSTLIGGQSADILRDIAIAPDGRALVAGFTTGSGFPLLNPIQQQYAGGTRDAIVAELNETGSALVFSTYLGGDGDDTPYAVALDPGGNAYVTGYTLSSDFPTVNAIQSENLGGGGDGFVTRITDDRSVLTYSTYLGSTGPDLPYDIAVDGLGNAILTGFVGAADFPTTPGAIDSSFAGGGDAFVTAVAPSGASLFFSTFLGGAAFDLGSGIAIGQDGSIALAGNTDSADFPVQNPFQTSPAGDADAFATKLLYTPPAVAELTWDAPSGGTGAPPSNLVARIIAVGPVATASRATAPALARSPGGLTGYKVYRSASPSVQTTPANLLASVPPSQTSMVAPVDAGGSFFVITAAYGADQSAPSNEVSAGTPGATITKLKVKRTGITATGTGFTATVQVFIDGIPFTTSATVKNGQRKVAQKGTLVTGQTIGAYGPPGTSVEVIFLNNDGTITRRQGTIP